MEGASIESKRKLEKFDFSWFFEFCNEFSSDNLALKAFGTLLESSNLSDFTNDEPDPEAEDLRFGLKDIVELCINRHKLKAEKLSDRIYNTPEYVIKRSKNAYKMTREGCWATHVVALKETRMVINDINEVILRFGEEEYPEAMQLLNNLLDLELIIKEKISLDVEKQQEVKI